jgi:hypothetical protein
MCVNAADDWLVPDHVGTRDPSKREGPRCGASEEVMGLVRGPSEGLVMLWVRCAPHTIGYYPCRVIGVLPSVSCNSMK